MPMLVLVPRFVMVILFPPFTKHGLCWFWRRRQGRKRLPRPPPTLPSLSLQSPIPVATRLEIHSTTVPITLPTEAPPPVIAEEVAVVPVVAKAEEGVVAMEASCTSNSTLHPGRQCPHSSNNGLFLLGLGRGNLGLRPHAHTQRQTTCLTSPTLNVRQAFLGPGHSRPT
jgi:hypothetical protein